MSRYVYIQLPSGDPSLMLGANLDYQISAYLLVPDKSLAPDVGDLELATATQYLAGQTKSQPRKVHKKSLLL